MVSIEKDNCGCGFIADVKGRVSHRVIKQALTALQRLIHRGAVAEDGLSADGCGVLLQMPRSFFRDYAQQNNLPLHTLFAVGMCFLNPKKKRRNKQVVTEALSEQGFSVVAWRDLAIDSSICGEHAYKSLPKIAQVLVNIPDNSEVGEVEARLLLARHRASTSLLDDPHFYICSLSTQVIIYKALVLPKNLAIFYKDLANTKLKSAFCIFHQRFSTNTLSAWRLAQPFRFLAHNGEINTIQGNRHAALARDKLLTSKLFPYLDSVRPIVDVKVSDSASLDNILEFLIRGGMNLFQAIRLLIPPAWQKLKQLSPERRAYFSYYSLQMEPWDGPASVVFSDGQIVCCALDRNGFRPARYLQTKDGLVIACSEVGVIDLDEETIGYKGKLGPGELIAVDTKTHQVLTTELIDSQLSARRPYPVWLHRHAHYVPCETHLNFNKEDFDSEALTFYRKLYDLSDEESNEVLVVMAETGKEATSSMGDDTPIAVLSTQPRVLFDYFRQKFAQVTNPPMDSLRESMFMSLETTLGRRYNLFDESEHHTKRVILSSPVLSSSDLDHLKNLSNPDYRLETLPLAHSTGQSLARAITSLCNKAVSAVKNGAVILLLSDKIIKRHDIPIHPLLAVGAIYHRLIEEGLRYDCDLLVESGWVRDSHHFAVLLTYGAAAIYPYLAYALIQQSKIEKGLVNYVKAIENGILKICAKMGVSTISSYRGAQLCDIIGLSQEVVNRCFSQSSSTLNLLDFTDLDSLARTHFDNAHNPYSAPRHGGLLKYLPAGEYHDFNPDVVMTLLEAAKKGERQLYQQFSSLLQNRPLSTVRDLLDFKSPKPPLALTEVEPIATIYPRFETAAMSLGALSPEAHEALAVAMNTLGGRSNSGEGGEASYRHKTLMSSKIKQIASGRFGVTAEYLSNAEVIQIKIAQGAKPGEGGQLPGNKVNATIAHLRHCSEGITLISPPPHHDIYSIEDLGQLIFDLKEVNPEALISVKLVAGSGIGTIAAGVAKAYADIITVSGYDGGTGASPITSIKYTGLPWELGLQETHQLLLDNHLRHRVILQVDGGLKTGQDVVKAAMLGAECFGFGTAPMVALGCKYLRICHLNNCVTGIATQDDFLRQYHYQGNAQRVINYFTWLAEEVREILASLGFASLDEVIGRNDLLQKKELGDPLLAKLDLSSILAKTASSYPCNWLATPKKNHPIDRGELAQRIQKTIEPLLQTGQPIKLHFPISNKDRAVGAKLSGYLAKHHGLKGLENDAIQLFFTGSAGQSFGAWNCQGLTLDLTGEANDYVGKGMNGGKLVLRPSENRGYPSKEATIAGNTCLYGATGGYCYMAGLVGERFAVRNSGAIAVVEGAGAHCCEYMTGGVVVVLGEVSVNFGAGMTGGVAFVLDLNNSFATNCNTELISLHRLSEANLSRFSEYLKQILQRYVEATRSAWGQHLYDSFNDYLPLFWLIKPSAINWDDVLDNERN